jgi:hypothetical protein
MNAPAPKLPDPIAATPNPPPAGTSPPAPASEATPPAGAATPPAPGATPPAEAKPKASSIYEAAGVDEPGKEGSSAWPTDWRDQMAAAAGDPKSAKTLERFQSPAEVAKALIAAQQKIRSGEYKRAAPPGDNPEEIKAWREEQGIPDSPDGYEIPGVDLSQVEPEAKVAIDHIRTRLHGENFDKGKAAVVATLLQEVAQMEMQRTAEADANRMDAVEDALRSEWGADYRKNLNMNGALLNQHFGEDMDSVLKARMPDGTRLADNPVFNRFLNAMARASGNDVMFDGDAAGGTSIDARLDQIRQVMNTNINEYHAKGLDVEYAQLLEKKEARKR